MAHGAVTEPSTASAPERSAAAEGPAPDIGAALAEQAVEISRRILERWKENAKPAPGARHAQVERDILRATEAGTRAVAGYLSTGQPVTREQSEVWDATGEAPLHATVSLSEITKVYLYWREEMLRAVRRLQATEHLDVQRVDHAIGAIQLGSDRSIVRMAKRFEATRHALEQQLAERRLRLEHQALHDPLTGLANRALFLDRLTHALEMVARRPTRPAVIYLDLDHFKWVNDGAGHSVGDQFLVEVSARLQDSVRPSDTLARLGGDEFAVLCEDLEDPVEQASAVAGRIMAQLARSLRVGGRELSASASIGVAIGGPGDDAEMLLSRADQAMYRAKQLGRRRVEHYDPELDDRAARYEEIAGALRPVLERGELSLTLQPVIDLRTDRVVARAAGLRGRHPVLTDVPAVELVRVAEQDGQGHRLTQWLVGEACRWCAGRRAAEDPEVKVSVPVSGHELAHPDFPEVVHVALRRSGLPPGALTLCFDGALVMAGRPETRAALDCLRALGARIAIDEFGSDSFSVAWLARLPVDAVHIDAALLAPVADPGRETLIVEALVQLAHTLGLVVMADGVETEEQLSALRRCGCDQAQGPLVGTG